MLAFFAPSKRPSKSIIPDIVRESGFAGFQGGRPASERRSLRPQRRKKLEEEDTVTLTRLSRGRVGGRRVRELRGSLPLLSERRPARREEYEGADNEKEAISAFCSPLLILSAALFSMASTPSSRREQQHFDSRFVLWFGFPWRPPTSSSSSPIAPPLFS